MAFALFRLTSKKNVASFTYLKPAIQAIQPPQLQVRNLNLHEHQSMDVMHKYNVKTPKGIVATSPEEARKAFKELVAGGAKDVVVKAQALTGGRGLGFFKSGLRGGVHMCFSEEEAERLAKKMLNQTLVTKQTGAKGIPVSKVFLMERIYMRREMYLSILYDRARQGPVIVASPAGGTSIEDVAAATPELIFTEAIDIMQGPKKEQLEKLAKSLKVSPAAIPKAVEQIENLYRMFIDVDATLVEINPMAETPDGEILAADAKINFDDNAEYRHKDIHALRDLTQEDPREVAAKKYDLNYIGLDGSIGCLVNGAGLAMSTMDIIKLKGGSPANFLDVGGGATEHQVTKAFEILNNDPKVRAIFCNIFGGIMRCDVIASGIIAAATNLGVKKPIVIRLMGTNVEKAKNMIENCGFRMIVAEDLEDGAEKAVKIARIVEDAEKINVNVQFELPL